MQPGGTGYYKTLPSPFPHAFNRALKLMTKPDTTTCGDLIFSGHSSFFVLTLSVVLQYLSTELVAPCNYFRYTLTKSTVRTIKQLHVLLTLFGMVAILATKFHYTIDVLLAAYLCRSAWNQYHQAALLARSPSINVSIESPIVKQSIFNSIVYFLEDDEDAIELSDLWLTTNEVLEMGEEEEEEVRDSVANTARRTRRTTTKNNVKNGKGKPIDGASLLMRVMMVFAGSAVCFILFRTIISNSDYSEKSTLSFKDVKSKMDLVSDCVGQCFREDILNM